MRELLWIEADVSLGCDLRDAARLAVDLADRMQAGVKIEFSGVKLYVRPGTTPGEVVGEYWTRSAGGRKG